MRHRGMVLGQQKEGSADEQKNACRRTKVPAVSRKRWRQKRLVTLEVVLVVLLGMRQLMVLLKLRKRWRQKRMVPLELVLFLLLGLRQLMIFSETKEAVDAKEDGGLGVRPPSCYWACGS